MQPLLTANRETNKKIEKTNDKLHSQKYTQTVRYPSIHTRHTTTNTQKSIETSCHWFNTLTHASAHDFNRFPHQYI